MRWKRNVNAALSIGIINETEYIEIHKITTVCDCCSYVYPNTLKVELVSQTLLELLQPLFLGLKNMNSI